MTESPKRGLLAAYRRLLRPLVRILIRNGVVFEEFQEVARRAFVDVALKDTQATEQATDYERIAALTGLDRTEILAIQERGRKDSLSTNLNLLTLTLSGWHTDSDFTGPYGVPIELRLDAQAAPDFRELVRRFVGDTDVAEELLRELLDAGAVVETEKGWFKAITRSFIPRSSAPSGMEHLARSVEDFVTTFDYNAREADPRKRLFERQAYTSDGIRPEDVPRFQEFAYMRAKVLLEELDNWISQLETPDRSQATRLVTGLGVYHYIGKEPDYD